MSAIVCRDETWLRDMTERGYLPLLWPLLRARYTTSIIVVWYNGVRRKACHYGSYAARTVGAESRSCSANGCFITLPRAVDE